MDVCEFCNKEADVEGTSMTGAYCIDCLRLTRHECLDAIKKLQKCKKGQKMARQEKGEATKEKYDNALNALLHGPGG